MKKISFYLLFGILFSIVVACNDNAIKDGDVLKIVYKYKTEQYTIMNPENAPTGNEIAKKVKGYLSEEVLEEQIANRVFEKVPSVAMKMNKRFKLEEVKLKREKENDNGSIDYSYKLIINVTDDQSTQVIEKDGQLTISENDGLRITRDWEEATKLGNEVL